MKANPFYQNPAVWFAAFLFALAVLLYVPGLTGPYILDDHVVLVGNTKLLFEQLTWNNLYEAAFSKSTGPLHRPITLASFGLSYYLFGTDQAYAIKIGNLLLHIATGIGLYLLTVRVLRQLRHVGGIHRHVRPQLTAALIVGLWLLHPLHVSTVLYSVQRLAILASFFTVFALLGWLHGRCRLNKGDTTGLPILVGSVALGGCLAAFSKESGVLLIFYALVLEASLFRFSYPEAVARWQRYAANGLLILPAAAILVYLCYSAIQVYPGIPYRPFTMVERLLTQPKILLYYLLEIFSGRSEFMGLFLDGISVVRSWREPAAVASIFAVTGMLVFGIWGAVKQRLLVPSFAILWFFSGHLLESTVIQLELAFEHRNYLAAFGPAVLVGYYLLHPTLYRDVTSRVVGIAFPLIFIVHLSFELSERVGRWETMPKLLEAQLEYHPDAPRSWSWTAAFLSRNGFRDEGVRYFIKAAELNSREPGYVIEIVRAYTEQRKPTPKPFLDEAYQRVATYGLTRHAVNELYLLGLSLNSDVAHQDTLVDLFRAALKGKYWPGKHRTFAQASLARLLFWREEREEALVYWEKAKSNLPPNIKRKYETLFQRPELQPGA